MSAADKRAELEAAIWRLDQGTSGPQMDAILAAADAYAAEAAAEVVDQHIRDTRTAEHRDRPEQAASAAYGRAS